MKIRAAESLANMIETPTKERIIPSPFDVGVADTIAKAIY
jgi:malic enzyme